MELLRLTCRSFCIGVFSDDENISALYRKIQLGKYELPKWLSEGSIRLLDSMLQTDPKRRITVDQLMAHPWLVDGFDRPVKWQSKYHVSELDDDVVNEIAAYKVTTPAKIAEHLKKWDYSSSLVVTYFLLLSRKHRGLQLGLTPIRHSPQLGRRRHETPKRNLLHDINGQNGDSASGSNSIGNSPRGLHNSLEGGLEDIELLNIGSPQQQTAASVNAQRDGFDRAKNRASERYPIPNKKRIPEQSQQQPHAEDKENSAPPTARKNHHGKATVAAAAGAANSPLSPSRSMDSGLNDKLTPKKSKSSAVRDDWIFATPDRPISSGGGGGSGAKSNRKVFGSIERGLDKMKNMLTPRKHRLSSSDGPSLVTGKALCNVSTTSHHNPDTVLNDLAKALVAKGIPCQQKGYILRGKIKDASGFAKLSFELEVCRIPNLNVVGIRRKRLKGDAWCYKKVCEEVLRLAAVSKA